MSELKSKVRSVLPKIEDHLRNYISNGKHAYETFGKEVEEPAVEILLQELKKEGLIKDYKIASHKNEFPDLRVKILLHGESKWVAIDVKASNHSSFRNGAWQKTNSPANDLGTFKTLPSHVEEYGGENIYFLWVHYDFTDEKKEIIKVEFDSFYNFVGMTNGLLKYRVGDGKIRPRLFDQSSFFGDFENFMEAFNITDTARHKKLIMRHINSLLDSHSLTVQSRESLLSEIKLAIMGE